MVAKQNLRVYQGSDFRRVMEFKTEDDNLIDLTGFSFKGQVKASYSDSTPVMSFTFEIRNQETDKGMVDMRLLASDSALINIPKMTKYLYDIEMTDQNGVIRRVVEGTLELMPEVTK